MGTTMVEFWLRGEPMNAAARRSRPLRIMSCCRKDAETPTSRSEKMARYSPRFTRD